MLSLQTKEYTIICQSAHNGFYEHLKDIGLIGYYSTNHDPEAVELAFNILQRSVT
jgi:hypothetical protein